jgi:hypothetical protein
VSRCSETPLIPNLQQSNHDIESTHCRRWGAYFRVADAAPHADLNGSTGLLSKEVWKKSQLTTWKDAWAVFSQENKNLNSHRLPKRK